MDNESVTALLTAENDLGFLPKTGQDADAHFLTAERKALSKMTLFPFNGKHAIQNICVLGVGIAVLRAGRHCRKREQKAD
jgi:hypothetical protein